ncbi:MAG: translational machinery protein [Polyangiaceae bacterium]
MTLHSGSAVWIDHKEARIFHVSPDSLDESVVKAPAHHIHRHGKGAAEEHHHPDDMHHFFAEVAKAIEKAEQVLIVGPSTAKLQFLRYLHGHAPAIEPRVVGIETADHPTDRQLVSHIKHHFGVTDRVR